VTDFVRPSRVTLRAWLARAWVAVRAIPWYPLAFAVALVLAFHMASGVHVLSAIRAMVVAAVGVGIVQVLATTVLRDRDAGALVATVALVVVFGWEAVRLVVLVPEVRWYLLLFVPSAILLIAALARRRRDPQARLFDPRRASGVLARLPVPVVLAVLLFGLNTGALAQDLKDLAPRNAATGRATLPTPAAPDIWMILLDGHARRDTMMRLFGYDDGPFLDALAAQGLEVATHNRSNYTLTELSLPSLLHMAPLDQVAPLRALVAGQQERVQPSLRVALNENPVFDLLREHGYEIVTSAPPYEDVTIRGADRYLDDGQINEFEIHLMRSTVVLDVVNAAAPDFLSAEHRARLMSAFGHIDQEAGRSVPFPRFIFVHVVGPHMPAVFDANGAPIRAPNTFNWYSDTIIDRELAPDEFGRLYSDQARYLDGLTAVAVQHIVAADPDGVVIVFSDHGSRSRLDVHDPTASDFDEATANLFAARTPGHEHLFPDTITLVNVFPTLLNAYFGLQLPTSADSIYTPVGGGLFPDEVVPTPTPGA
jgi:hypothetical protein